MYVCVFTNLVTEDWTVQIFDLCLECIFYICHGITAMRDNLNKRKRQNINVSWFSRYRLALTFVTFLMTC